MSSPHAPQIPMPPGPHAPTSKIDVKRGPPHRGHFALLRFHYQCVAMYAFPAALRCGANAPGAGVAAGSALASTAGASMV
jgi:hypothetical protein